MNILSYLNLWLSNIMEGYWISILLLCTAFIVWKRNRAPLQLWIIAANRTYALVSLLAMICYVSWMFYNWYGPMAQEYKMFIGYRIIGNPWAWVYWMAFAGAYVLPQLFWFRRLSGFIPLILLLVLIMHTDHIVEYFSKAYRDYYSLWWSIGAEINPWGHYLSMLIFPIVLSLYLYVRNRYRGHA